MKAHFSDLSADCQAAIVRAAAVGRACKADVNQFCANVEPGKGAIADCMKEHAAEISGVCREAMTKAEEGETSAGAPPTVPLPAPQVTQQNSTGVALQTEGGTLLFPVLVNGAIKLNFTIDSGSPDVSIPADAVMTLIRTGTIGSKDFSGSTTYKLADGSTLPSPNFNIRSLKVGKVYFNNVTGSVAPVNGSPLLGQSFLSRFRSWSIDNRRQMLILTKQDSPRRSRWLFPGGGKDEGLSITHPHVQLDSSSTKANFDVRSMATSRKSLPCAVRTSARSI